MTPSPRSSPSLRSDIDSLRDGPFSPRLAAVNRGSKGLPVPMAAPAEYRDGSGMSAHTGTPASSDASGPSSDVTLGARLAAASRRSQGFTTAVDDPAVLAKLRGLCTVPRPENPLMTGKHDGPAP